MNRNVINFSFFVLVIWQQKYRFLMKWKYGSKSDLTPVENKQNER